LFASRNVHFAMSALSIPSKGLCQWCVTTSCLDVSEWQNTTKGF
jgi:hypothetical protein